MNPLRLVFVEPKGGGKIQDGVTVTPTKEEQTVEPDPGFDGLSAVTVEAIPDAYQDVTGVNAGAEDIRVGKVGIDAQGNLLNGEMLPRKPEQEKSVVPTKQAQTVSPDPSYALSAVNVAKIPDAYQDVSFVDAGAADIRVGKTGVSATGERLDGQMFPQKPEQSKSVTPTKSSQLIEPDAGYALSAVEVDAIPDEYANVSRVTAEADKVKSGYVFVDSEGVETQGTNTDDADTSDGTMSASQLEAGEVGYSRGQRIVGTKPIRSADVEIDSLAPVPIPAGSYDGTTVAKLADPTEVDAQYILQGHEILGIQGQAVSGDTLNSVNDNTMTAYTNATWVKIKDYLFFYNSSLTSVAFSNVSKIGESAFNECTGLANVSMPSVATIGARAFYHCTALVDLFLPAESVGVEAFRRCENLMRIQLPNATIINRGAFYDCKKMTDFIAPSLVSVDSSQSAATFGNCFLLAKLDFGTSISRIDTFAFASCWALTVVIVRSSSVCTIRNSSVFYDTPFAQGGTGGTIYIPETLYNHLGDGTALDYKAATNWSVIDAYGTITWAKIEGSQYEVTNNG